MSASFLLGAALSVSIAKLELEGETEAPSSGDRPARIRVEGRYELVDRLGSGAMGVVYRAQDVWLNRPVAIKLIDPSRARDPLAADLFQREARALAKLRHDNVVQVYAYGPHSGTFFIAMEYVEGRDLDHIIQTHAANGTHLPLEQVISILLRIGYGLSAAHERELTHRDVKPSNILVENETNRPVLIDFGLVRRKGSTPSLAVGGGTPCYMPPEQALDVDGTLVGPTADVYALACTAFEMLTNQPVFDGPTAVAILQAHSYKQPPRVSLHRPELEPLDRVLLRALSKKSVDRHASAKAFVDELANAAKRVKRSAGRSSVPAKRAPLRVILLMKDEGLRRHVARIIERTVDGAGDFAAIEVVVSERELESAFEREAAPILVVDRECADDIGATVAKLRHVGRAPEVLVLSRRDHLGLPICDPDVKEIPKPINAQVMASVISKMAARVTLRRVTE